MLRITIALGVLACAGTAAAALPTFENQTPTGFSTQDSTDKQDFVEGQAVTVRVDLNQAVTPTYPAIGNFHNLETAGILESRDVDGLRADVAVSDGGIIHTAWITQDVVSPVTTPVYNVRYARSNDGGGTFSSPVSVSGSLRFDLLTIDGGGPSFSTVDIEVDSRGNPRVVYAFNHSPDGHTVGFASNPDNVYFNHSENGGASWLPNNSAIRVNDIIGTATNTEGLLSAFPRMAIDQRDNIYITYVRGATTGGGAGTDDVMLAKVNRSTSPFTMEQIGSAGTIGSSGGVRIATDGVRQTGPDIDVGTGDVLHIIYFREDVVSANSTIEHKTLLADYWDVVDASGWNQGVDGATVDGFDPEPATNALLEQAATFFFPGIAVDQVSSPDRVYAFYKFAGGGLETVFFNDYVYDNAIAGNAGWLPAQASAIWSTASSAVFDDGDLAYNIELDWTVTERVEAVIDDRRSDRGDVHIVFTAGYSNEAVAGPHEHDIYYAFYNGVTWTLPEKVADDDSDSGTEDGIRSTDTFLAAPAIAKGADSDNLFMVFAGGTAEGLGVSGVTDADHHAYFKVLGRAVSSEDVSIPVGGYQYDLDYTPVNPHNATADIDDQAVWVHVADNVDGGGLGATGKQGDGFLAGDWETVAAFTLADDDKFFEGRINEDASNTHEWGDDNDKIGLLVKLNVLGTDSASNLQVVNNSTASDAGSGKGARTISVGAKVSTFIAPLDFFLLGADIDIVDSNTAPTVKVIQPDGAGDVANESYSIKYTLTDPDDDISTGGLLAALYFSEHRDLSSVQDIRIFGTKIVDENDNSAVFVSGTDDFREGTNESYRWDDPSAALKAKLFASIFQARSGTYYIYLVADDQKNPAVFARSPGAVTILHKPIVEYVDPAGIDTVDTGVRSGHLANPYDLDFYVRDFDLQGSAEVQLFYSAVSGLSSISISGFYPNQNFVLGKSLSGTRATAIENSDTLTTGDVEFSWDLTDSVCVTSVCAPGDSSIVREGSYFLYAVANDSVNTTVGRSNGYLIVKHSPQFTFYEPPRDSHRRINTGSQPVFTIQWQKGSGDKDFDDDATIDLYFTTDNPATINYEDVPDSLLKDADTKTIVKGLSEDGDAGNDMYVWDFRNPPADVAADGQKVWTYAVISDGHGNRTEELGGALTIYHSPFITLTSADLDNLNSFDKNDALRITWDDYLVDDGASTDDAYIRLYAAESPSSFATVDVLDSAVDGISTFLINSSDGSQSGTLQTIRESDENFFDWNTALFGNEGTDYDIYAVTSEDPAFSQTVGGIQLSRSSSPLSIGTGVATPNVTLSPTDQAIAIGDTFTFDVMIQNSTPINLVQIVMSINSTDFLVLDQDASKSGRQPFIDLNNVFAGVTAIEDTFDIANLKLRFAKSSFGGELVGTATEPVALARFQLAALRTLGSPPSLTFDTGATGTAFGQVGNPDLLYIGSGISKSDPELTRTRRGIISATVELEGRTVPVATFNHQTHLDVHLRVPGSTIDITDAEYVARNDTLPSTADTVEVQTSPTGALLLFSVPAGRYVLTVKDTSHVSGRSDTFTVRNGETVTINDDTLGFYGSDLRGDLASLLPATGAKPFAELIAGDVSEDNEINEDDINLIVAAWGVNPAAPYFKQADINNDNKVGAPDLTVTTSNFGNSVGFGAPPVYKRTATEVLSKATTSEDALLAARTGLPLQRASYVKPVPRGDNAQARLEVRPLFDMKRQPRRGEQLEIEIAATDIDDLAGYEFDLRFDPEVLRLIPEGVREGDIFAANPYGAVFEVRSEEGVIRIISSRIGKRWSAQGEGTLATLQFEALDQVLAEVLEFGDGVLLTPRYSPQPVQWGSGLFDSLLPTQFELDQNYPNPFNPSTTIPFAVPNRQHVQLEIYNVLGQRIRTLLAGPLDQGYHTIVWNGRDDSGRSLAGGLYFSLLQTAEFRETRKMMLVK